MKFAKHRMSVQGLVKRTQKRMARYAKFCADDTVRIFDIGANVGLYAVCFANYMPNSKVYAFEPMPDNFQFLKQNVSINKLTKRVFPYMLGFWSEEKTMELGYPEDRKDYDNTGLYSIYGPKKTVSATFKVLDTWCDQHGFYPDFIKLDVEGCEKSVLDAASNSLDHCKYIIYEDNNNYKEQNQGIEEILTSYGFAKRPKVCIKGDMFWSK